MPKNFEIKFYETATGNSPAYDFIKAQEPKIRAKIFKLLELLQEQGYSLRMPYSEALGDGIFQVRAQIGNNITRVLYFFFVGQKIILTNGFVKKTQETPSAEIELAKKYRADFLDRSE